MRFLSLSDRQLVHVALFAALIAALGLVPNIPIAAGVPITAQSLGVMLAGVILGPRLGALAVLLFLAAVALGLPLLAGGRGGIGVFVSPSVGFLVGFPVAAWVAGVLMRLPLSVPVSAAIAAVAGGIFTLYAFGIPGLMLMLEMSWVEAFVVSQVYLPGDAIKAVLCAWIAHSVHRAYPAILYSRATSAQE